jgi:hypothetical protein
MRKIRSDAFWHKLAPKQQKQIEQWFFIENISYRAVRDRMRKKFGVSCALSAIGPMYHHCRERRSQEREAVLERLTEIVVEPGSHLKHVRTDTMKAIAGRLFRRAVAQDDTMRVSALGRVMMQADARENDARRVELVARKFELARLQAAVDLGAISLTEFLAQIDDLKPPTSGNCEKKSA